MASRTQFVLSCRKLLVLLAVPFALVNSLEAPTKDDMHILSRKIRQAVFPEDATQGLFLAIAIPIELPGRAISYSYNYEANYKLPFNATQYTNPNLLASESAAGAGRRTRRSMDRRHAYVMIEKRLTSKGLNGKACILRTICETAETNLQHNGLIGDLVHILFTPSTSTNKKLHQSFSDAEMKGAQGFDCRSSYPECPIGLFDFITILDL